MMTKQDKKVNAEIEEIEAQKELTIQLPVKFDTPLYFLWSKPADILRRSEIYMTDKWKYAVFRNGIYITTTGKSVGYRGEYFHKLGETVFLTKEEAEAKIKELEGKNG